MKTTALRTSARFSPSRPGVISIIGLLATTSLQAQIGSGWSQYTSGPRVQYQVNGSYQYSTWKASGTVTKGEGSYNYNTSTRVETFRIWDADTNRIEVRCPTYTSGEQQMEGYIRVNDAMDRWVAQVFHAALIKYEADEGGRYVYHSASAFDGSSAEYTKTLRTGIKGLWTKMNIVHSANTNRIVVYVNGSKIMDHVSGDTGDFYLKYGNYGNTSSTDRVVEWRDVKLFRK